MPGLRQDPNPPSGAGEFPHTFGDLGRGAFSMKIPTFIDKTPTGTVTAIQWNCGCAWDVDAGLFICEMHQEDPEA